MSNVKGVVCYTPDGEYVTNYKSVATAALRHGVSSAAVSQAIHTKGLCAGYRWLPVGEKFLSAEDSLPKDRPAPVSGRANRIARYDMSGKFVAEYPSIRAAAISVCGDPARMSLVAKTGRPYKSCYWRTVQGGEKPQSGITPPADKGRGKDGTSYLLYIPAELNGMSIDGQGEYTLPFYLGGTYPSLRQVALSMEWPLSAVRWAVENKGGRYYTKNRYSEPKMVRNADGDMVEQYFMIVKAPERSVLENIAEGNSSLELEGYVRKGRIDPDRLRAAEEAAEKFVREVNSVSKTVEKTPPATPALKTKKKEAKAESLGGGNLVGNLVDDYDEALKAETETVRELGDDVFRVSELARYCATGGEMGVANSVAREFGLDWSEIVAQYEMMRDALASRREDDA